MEKTVDAQHPPAIAVPCPRSSADGRGTAATAQQLMGTAPPPKKLIGGAAARQLFDGSGRDLGEGEERRLSRNLGEGLEWGQEEAGQGWGLEGRGGVGAGPHGKAGVEHPQQKGKVDACVKRSSNLPSLLPPSQPL